MVRVRSGSFRHRIAITEIQNSVDANGDPTETWVAFDSRWASIAPQSGTEVIEGDRATSDVTHRFGMRFVSGLTPANRITFGDREFEIVSVLNTDETGVEHVVEAKEVVTGG